MKYAVLLSLAAFWLVPAKAQEVKYLNCQNTFFKSTKKVATSICYDADNRWGIALAFTKDGKEIYRQHVRKIAGHASVYFSYYPSGVVSKAEYSSAPDGGIQWSRSLTQFSENGTLTSFTEEGTDNQGNPKIWTQLPPETPFVRPAPKPETIACAPICLSEAWFINTTKYAVRITGHYTGSIADPKKVVLAPGDTARGGSFVGAASFSNPASRVPYPFLVEAVGTHRKPSFRLILCKEELIAKDLKRYYYVIK